MISPNLTYFDLDLADIWEYELDCYNAGSAKPFSFYYNLYLELQTLFLKHGHKPFLSPDSIKAGTHKYDYYLRELNRLEQREENHLFKIFERSESLYDMTIPCVVKKRKINKLTYQKLFALKLSQYNEGLIHLKDFLLYHFKKTFKNDFEVYSEFIRLTLDQWSSIIHQKVVQEAREIIPPLRDLPAKKIRTNSSKKQNPNSQTDFNIPDKYENVAGNMTKSEIEKCFSFLYLEKSKNGQPYLKKKDVDYIFRYGIAIPPSYLKVKRVKLNCTKAFPISIIKTAIYRFFRNYSKSNKLKLNIVRFFASYIEDFHRYLDSPENLKTLAGNIPGIPPKYPKFNLDDYIEPLAVIIPDKIIRPGYKA